MESHIGTGREPESGEEYEGEAIAETKQIEDNSWYWGSLSGGEADRILAEDTNGSFLIRNTRGQTNSYSIAYNLKNQARHLKIEYDQGNYPIGKCTKIKGN